MRVKSSQLIKFCSTLTDPATKTMSIGLWAYAQVSWFLLRNLDSFIVTRQISSTYRDLVPSRQITVTQYLSPPTRTCKNHATATRTATQLNRRAVSRKQSLTYCDTATSKSSQRLTVKTKIS